MFSDKDTLSLLWRKSLNLKHEEKFQGISRKSLRISRNVSLASMFKLDRMTVWFQSEPLPKACYSDVRLSCH